MFKVYPRQQVPSLIFQTLSGGVWDVKNANPEYMTMLVFYRGLHCPVCKKYLQELDQKLDEFRKRGVDVVAVSSDTSKQANKAKEEWDIEKLSIGCNLDLETAQNWGLFVSRGIDESEPEYFSEPGLFIIDKDQKLYYSSIQTMPNGRPHFDDILKAIDFIKKKDQPARGEVMETMEAEGQPH